MIKLRLAFPELDIDDFKKKLSKEKYFYLKKRVSQADKEKLWRLGEKGIIFEPFQSRIYPHANLYSHIVGQVDYDNFVMDYVSGSKSIIKDIGLNWEDKILKFHENNRAVETNSLLQVRDQVYQNSSKNWKKYEKYLTPVMEILKNNNIKF